MNLGTHEAAELNELLLSCVNSIQSMALFMNQAQDPQLRSMIQRHFAVHVQDYNMKVEFARQAWGSRDHLNVPTLEMNNYSLPTPQSYVPVQPEVKLARFDDRSIATSYLLTLKRAGREYAWAAFETTTPQLRGFLESAFMMCSHQSFEVWQFMISRGWYALNMAPQQAIQSIGQMYQEVPYQNTAALYQH